MSRRFSFRSPARPPGSRLAVPLLLACVCAWLPIHRAGAAPASLALPRTALPAGASVRGHADTSTTAGTLHESPFAALGQMRGYGETARWSPAEGTGVSLLYHAALYPDALHAATAYGDARATAWEYGRAMRVGSRLAFRIKERKNRVAVVLVMHRGNAEAEIQLRYDASLSPETVHRCLHALDVAAAAASEVMATTAATRQNRTTMTSAQPFIAPPGTGPVVKSPSLMVMQGMTPGPQTAPDPGAYRTGPPGISNRLTAPQAVPQSGLSRFAVTSTDAAGGQWYNSATLYANPAGASAALTSMPGSPVTVTGAAEARLRQMGKESILTWQVDNVVMVLAGFGVTDGARSLLAQQLTGTVPTWLHAGSTKILDARGNPVHLAAVNWYGAESPDFVVGGLDFRPYGQILQTISDLGYNAIRIPFSNQMVEQNPVVTAHLAANPDLRGKHALDILDAVISYAGALGLSVILDNHRSEAGWSSQPSGLWYTPQYSDASFVADWALLAARYARSNTVVGLDLRNEPHGTATWGSGDAATDWKAAAERAGNAALAVNPNVLVIVEGVQYYGTAPSAWWGGNLMGVATAPVVLRYANGASARDRLVYSAHDYGPAMCGNGCPWFNSGTTYASLAQVWDSYFGFIAADPTKPYAAPVWLGEFGTCNLQKTCVADTTPGSQGQWFSSLVQYLSDRHMGWAYWAANGTQSSGATRAYGQFEGYGLLSRDWTAPTPFVHDALHGIMHDLQPPSSR